MKKTFLISIAFLWVAESMAQSGNFIFSHLTTRDGLSDNVVTCFLKDSRGIFWIGTRNGLNRYDGSHFYAYKKSKDTLSLFNSIITAICEDKKGIIWICTEAGVFKFDVYANQFRYVETPKRGYAIAYNNILCDNDGNVWATGLWSLTKFNETKQKFEEKLIINNNPVQFPEFQIKANGMIYDTAKRQIWLATLTGLVCYDIASGKHYDFNNQPGNPLFGKYNVAGLAASPEGYFWHFNESKKEIIAFDPVRKIILRRISISHIIPEGSVATIYEDRNNRLWLSSRTGNTLVIDFLKGNHMVKLHNRQEDKMSIANGFFFSVYEDMDGTLWFATITGISKCNPAKSLFRAHLLPERINILKNTSITIITEDPVDKSWWIGTLDNQVINYRPVSGTYQVYKLKEAMPNRNGIYPGGIFNITPVGNIIVIATVHGTWQLQRGKNRIEPFAYFAPELKDFKGRTAAALGDSVCFLSDGSRIIRINIQTGKAMVYSYPGHIKKDERHDAGFLFVDAAGKVWANSSLGRLIYTTGSNQLESVKIVRNEDKEFSGYFNTLDFDNKGNIWVSSTGFGLYCYNPATGDIRYWDETDGLKSQYLQKIKADKAGKIWIQTFSDVSVFSPATNSFHHFTIPYSENTISYFNSINRLDNGNIVGSIRNDIFEFFPDRLNLMPVKRKPEISMINVSGREIMITKQQKLILQPNENTLRFKFGLLTDREQFPCDFEYRLEGAEENWTKSATTNEAVYNNLAPGEYYFRVIARGKNNDWRSDEKIFAITIRAPFYKTRWFWILTGSLLAATLFFLYRFRIYKQKQILTLETKAQQLEKEKTMVMYDSLKQQLNPHFLFNSLTSLSGLIETDQKVAGNFLEQMSGIYRYILQNGDNETVLLKDEIEFVQLYISLQQTRFKKGLQVNIDVPEEYLHYKVAPVTLQNMIENAIKHNIIDTGSPLVIDIFIQDEYIVVKNNLQKKNNVETSNKKGLAQFVKLYQYLSSRPVVIGENDSSFSIKIPLI